MARSVIIHIIGKTLYWAKLSKTHTHTDNFVMVSNLRKRDGKDVHYLSPGVQTVRFLGVASPSRVYGQRGRAANVIDFSAWTSTTQMWGRYKTSPTLFHLILLRPTLPHTTPTDKRLVNLRLPQVCCLDLHKICAKHHEVSQVTRHKAAFKRCFVRCERRSNDICPQRIFKAEG
jgi:hypothetical protein